MSCESPFTVSALADIQYISYLKNLHFGTGTYTIPGYSIPGTQICLLGCNPAHCANTGSCCLGGVQTNCHWGGWRNSRLECSSSWNSCENQIPCCTNYVGTSWYWYDCTPGIPILIYPSLTFTAGAQCEMLGSVGVGLILPNPDPAPQPVESLTIKNIRITFGLESTIAGEIAEITPFTVTIPFEVELKDEDGSFSTDITLGTYEFQFTFFNAIGVEMFVRFTSHISLMFCLDPIPPMGWVNIEVNNTVSFNYTYDNTAVVLPLSFDLALPIVSVED